MQFGVVYSGHVYLGREGRLKNDTNKYENVLAVSYLYGAPAQLVVRKGSGITSTKDLVGTKVGVGTATTPVGAAPLSGTGNTSSEDCGGSDNATLSFSIAEQAMSSAMSGFYSDTLVLVVEPE